MVSNCVVVSPKTLYKKGNPSHLHWQSGRQDHALPRRIMFRVERQRWCTEHWTSSAFLQRSESLHTHCSPRFCILSSYRSLECKEQTTIPGGIGPSGNGGLLRLCTLPMSS